jgi:hypothetical protein
MSAVNPTACVKDLFDLPESDLRQGARGLAEALTALAEDATAVNADDDTYDSTRCRRARRVGASLSFAGAAGSMAHARLAAR